MTRKMDYAPRRVLAYMRDGYTLRSDQWGTNLLSPQANTIVAVNPRTLRVLFERQLVEADPTWNHHIVTRYRLTDAGHSVVRAPAAPVRAAAEGGEEGAR